MLNSQAPLFFLVEHAKAGKKAFYGCLTSSAYSTGSILEGLAASLFTAPFMPDWGWRIAFGIALFAGILIFYVRTHVGETPEYQQINHHDKPKHPFLAALKETPYAIIGVIGLAWLAGIMTFGTYVFTATYIPGMIATMIFSIPLFYLLSSNQIVLVTLGMVLMSVLIAITWAPSNAYMVSLFPKHSRYSGFGVAFNVGISIFGGTTPLVMMWLVDKTGNVLAPAWYYVAGAIIGLVSIGICEFGRRQRAYSPSIIFNS